jgi:hypothetical protein
MAKTKTYEAKWEFLRDELRKDFWAYKDAMELLCGWVKVNVTPEGRLGHGEYKQWFPLFETEQKRPKRDQFIRMRDIWDGSEHDYFQNNFRNVGSRNSLEIRVSHLIEWADSKKIEIPWRGWAEEMELLQENAPDSIPENKPMGKTKENNLYRLISIMSEMMVNSDKKSQFTSLGQLKSYIENAYAPKEGKSTGLKKSTLDDVLTEAGKIRPIETTKTAKKPPN